MEQSNDSDFLNYHHLRYFWTVAKEGSLRRASEKLKVSQPAMSTQIQQLGVALGGELFRPSGRSMVMTEFGQMIYGYAEEIFALGGEILRATKQAPGTRSLRLNVGIVDSFPKLMSYDILRPVFEHQPPVQLTCHEGKMADLVSQLNTHRLDVVLSDEPASPGIAGKVFNHLLGTSEITFCAMPELAEKLNRQVSAEAQWSPGTSPHPELQPTPGLGKMVPERRRGTARRGGVRGCRPDNNRGEECARHHRRTHRGGAGCHREIWLCRHWEDKRGGDPVLRHHCRTTFHPSRHSGHDQTLETWEDQAQSLRHAGWRYATHSNSCRPSEQEMVMWPSSNGFRVSSDPERVLNLQVQHRALY